MSEIPQASGNHDHDHKSSHTGTIIKAAVGILAIITVFVMGYLNKTEGAAPMAAGIRLEFLLFGITLLGVALLHHNTFEVAITGLVSVVLYKTLFISGFSIAESLHHESMILINLFGLLIGFGILAKHFEESHAPDKLSQFLPSGWMGGFMLLTLIFVLSSFLDNIAAAMIGGTIALTVFRNNVHIGYIAAIVACSNAGGSGSVVGDTTTTMMWIDGVAAMDVLHAYWGAIPALIICGIIASIQQDKLQPIVKTQENKNPTQWSKVALTFIILIGAITTNIVWDLPAAGVWIAIVLGALVVKTPWEEIPKSLKGTFFLLSLVMCASLMPVEALPKASPETALGLGFVSSFFDNIPLTKLALDQMGYDWGVLAYAVGFGGSMLWFGSSAGVAICNTFPQAKSVGNWLKSGWHVILAYVVGFYILLFVAGWNPHEPHKEDRNTPKTEVVTPDASTPAEQKNDAATEPASTTQPVEAEQPTEGTQQE